MLAVSRKFQIQGYMNGNLYFSKQRRAALWRRLRCARPEKYTVKSYAVGCLRAKEKFSKQHEFFAVGSPKSVYWNTMFKALRARLYAFEVLRGRQQNYISHSNGSVTTQRSYEVTGFGCAGIKTSLACALLVFITTTPFIYHQKNHDGKQCSLPPPRTSNGCRHEGLLFLSFLLKVY